MGWQTLHSGWTVGEVLTAAEMQDITDDLNYLFTSGGVSVVARATVSYATGGSTISYGVTFASAPLVTVNQDDAVSPLFVSVPAASRTTTNFKVKAFNPDGTELAAATSLAVIWTAFGNL